MIKSGILVHGGVGSPSDHNDGARKAAEKGMSVLRAGGGALDAVTEAAVILEDDGRFNAGSGSALRMDGKSMEMDASVMTSDARIGAVACVSGVPNPIRLARLVLNTPHTMLAGDGAAELAKIHGLTGPVSPTTRAVEQHRAFVGRLRSGKLNEAWKDFDIQANWNFETPYADAQSCDTVGAVALAADGALATANSTGGASPMLRGRVGDSPIIGCGFFCGPAAAVVTTGWGEKIVEKQLARWVYDQIAQGDSVARAVEGAVARFDSSVPIGVLAIGRRGHHGHHNRDMASWSIVEEA